MNCNHYRHAQVNPTCRTRTSVVGHDVDGKCHGLSLSSSVYSLHMNCHYSHSLDDAALLETLNSLLARKLIVPMGAPLNSNEPP